MTETEQVPPNIIEEMRQLALDTGEDLKIIQEEFGVVYVEDYLKEFDHPERCRQAAMIIKARRVDQNMMEGTIYEGVFISKTPPEERESTKDGKTRKFTIANAWGILVASDGEKHIGDPKLARIGLFDVAANLVDEIELGQSYRIKLEGGEKDGILELTANNKPPLTKIDLDLPKAADLIPAILPVIPLQEAPFNAGGFNDFRVIRGRVRRVRTNVTAKGEKTFYNVVDDDVSAGAYKQGDQQDFLVMCSASLPQYDQGSDLYFIGSISAETEEYSASMFASLIVPKLGILKRDPISGEQVSSVLPPEQKIDTVDMTDFDQESD